MFFKILCPRHTTGQDDTGMMATFSINGHMAWDDTGMTLGARRVHGLIAKTSLAANPCSHVCIHIRTSAHTYTIYAKMSNYVKTVMSKHWDDSGMDDCGRWHTQKSRMTMG